MKPLGETKNSFIAMRNLLYKGVIIYNLNIKIKFKKSYKLISGGRYTVSALCRF